jgi:transposase-like protein
LYGTEVSPDLISTITDEVLEEVIQWQQRPLEAMYPIVYFDALRLKIRDEGTVKNKAVFLPLGIRAGGRKDVPDLWIEQTEGAKFWLKVFNELKNRGLDDILIAVVDGLRGIPEAIEAVYRQAQIQTCVVHLIRNSTTLAAWKDQKELAAALKPFYQAINAEAAEAALDAFRASRPCFASNSVLACVYVANPRFSSRKGFCAMISGCFLSIQSKRRASAPCR